MIKLKYEMERDFGLLVELSRREFLEGFKGTSMRAYWSILQPLILLAVYGFALSSILSDRWANSESIETFIFSLFMGLLIYNAFTEVSAKSVRVIYSKPNYIKKVVFPIYLLPLSIVISSVIQMTISMGVWLVSYIMIFREVPFGIMIYPIILFSYIQFLLAIAFLLSLAGVILKDAQNIIGLLNHCLLFLSPVFYKAEDAPGILKKLLYLNPLTPAIESSRKIIMEGNWDGLRDLGLFSIGSLFFLVVMICLFYKGKDVVSDMV